MVILVQVYLEKFLVHVSDFRVLTSKKESVLHWACKGHKTNEKLVELLLEKWVVYVAIYMHSTMFIHTYKYVYTYLPIIVIFSKQNSVSLKGDCSSIWKV